MSQALADHLTRLILRDGPISVARYMEEVLGHPTLGYYIRKDPFGAAGDFVTAPEVSQMFGEMIGLWCAEVWRMMGRPDPVLLVELGPGRGTLMGDLLRAVRIVPAFDAAIECHLVETSPNLKDAQRERITRFCVWHARLDTVPRRPMLLIANEFFDALPVRQFVRATEGWRERQIDVAAHGAGFRFVLAPEPIADDDALPHAVRRCPVDTIVETAPARSALARSIGQRLAARGGAALIFDYGHPRSAPGDTLQAVRRHRYSDPLDDPGEADLTAHVDFEMLGRAATAGGATVAEPVEQGTLLRRLGIERRAEALAEAAGPAGRPRVVAAFDRLTAADQMGSLFKAMALRERRLPTLPDLDRVAAPDRISPPPCLAAPGIAAWPGIRHGFFGRRGGVSGGVHASLNCGLGSRDDAASVRENRRRVAAALGVVPASLLTAYQVHGKTALTVTAAWPDDGRPEADGLATDRPGIALGVLAADCAPVLLADAEAGVIGAAHAGWRGALAGVTDAVVTAMEALGARRATIRAAVGPCISQACYEVGADLADAFLADDGGNRRFFVPSIRAGHFRFDLEAYVAARLERAGIGLVERLGRCTYAEDAAFFSFRRATHRGEDDYGRAVSAIALASASGAA